MSVLHQKTFQKEATFSGEGLFTGSAVSITLLPADPGRGIVFQREDLDSQPLIPATIASLKQTPRCTQLAVEFGSVQMVEHLLSTLYAYGITNAVIRVRGPEIPAGDGSALPFVDLLERAGVCEQSEFVEPLRIEKPLFWSSGEVHLIAIPSEVLQVSYTSYHPQSHAFRSQYYSCVITPELYKKEIAPSRTFSFYEEIEPFLEKGLLRGATLENALVIRDDRVISPEGLRFPDELARHKILDLIGDISLIGRPLIAHIIAIRSGHASNAAFAKLMSF